MQGQYRLGVDAGGTFTDFVLAGRDGKIRLFKSASTPQDGTRAIAAGLAQMAEELGRPVEDIVRDCDLCINGTTVALNALIELKGVKVGLLCTAGHEDSIEIRLGHKEEGYRYDADYPPAPQLVPRRLRLPVRERVLADGSVRQPLNEDDVRAAIEVFKREGVQAVAVSFVWAPANPAHEQRALRMVAEAMPDVFVCAGHEVYPQVREYTRTSTTIVNAYLSPVMARYVARIDDYFRGLARAARCATSSPTAGWRWARSCAAARSTPSTPARPRRRRRACTWPRPSASTTSSPSTWAAPRSTSPWRAAARPT